MIPILELSTRTRHSSDNAAEISPKENVRALRNAQHALILIHGFANSEVNASASYAKFVYNVDKFLYNGTLKDTVTVFGFHWPGSSRVPVYNFLSYTLRPGVATRAGSMLGDALYRLPPTHRVTLVAHSLGCRVLLAAMTQLQTNIDNDIDCEQPQRGPRVSAVHLMAAAVPVGECAADDVFKFHHPGTHYQVLHSTRDKVLWAGFPAGQFPFGGRASAVGRRGQPFDRWDSCESTGLDHGDYWPSLRTAQLVQQSVLPLANRTLPQHPTPRRDLPTRPD